MTPPCSSPPWASTSRPRAALAPAPSSTPPPRPAVPRKRSPLAPSCALGSGCRRPPPHERRRDPPGPLVLDTSAIAAFARGSIHVGEVLAEIADEDAVALLPLACLVEAVNRQRFTSEEDARLDLLVGHPATEMLADD